MPSLGLYLAPPFFEHDAGRGHPERPARLQAVEEALERDGFAQSELVRLVAPLASEDDLARVHEPSYLDGLKRSCEGGGGQLDPDTAVSSASFEAATMCVGAGLDAVARIRAGELKGAFVAARPPGHHARPAAAMGFCIVNNVAVVAACLVADGSRVAILDWDAHHGNGTEEMFWSDPRVLYTSLHQYPYYPFTGAAGDVGGGEGAGFTVNVPMPAGAGPDDYIYALDRLLLPVLEEFEPDWLLVSAGFDAHRADPLCDLRLVGPTYRRMAHDALGLGRPVLGFLEGGYDLDALGGSVRETLGAWAGGGPGTHPGGGGVHPQVTAAVEKAEAAHKAAGSR